MNYSLYRNEYARLRPDADEEEIKRAYAQAGVGVPEALVQGIGAGFHSTLGGLGSFGEMVGLPTGDFAQSQYEKAQQYALPEGLQGYVWDDPSLLKSPAWWGYQTGQALPSVVSSFLPGAAVGKGASLVSKLSPYARALGAGTSGIMGGALEAGGMYEETGDRGQSALFGLASAGLNTIPMAQLLGGGSIPSRMVKGAFGEAITEWAEEPVGALITGDDPIRAMKEGLNVMPGAFASALLLGAPSALAAPNLKDAEKGADATQRLLNAQTLNDAMAIMDEMGLNAEPAAAEPGSNYTAAPQDMQPTLRELAETYGPDVAEAYEVAVSIPQTVEINTPERSLMRDQLVSELYGNGAPRKERQVDLILGPPASGKSTIAEDIAKENGAIIIDSDMAKERLPEFRGGVGANAVHLESKGIADRQLAMAIENGDNIVLPIVGKTTASVKEKLSLLRELGYTTTVRNVELPTNKSIDRALNRFRKTGRFVSPDYIKSVGDRPSKTYQELKNENAADQFAAYSTDVEFGQQPLRIEEGQAAYGAGRGGRATDQRSAEESGGGPQTATVVAEAVPSTSLPLGASLANAPFEARQRYTQDVMKALHTPDGTDLIMAAIKGQQGQQRIGTGSFEGVISPNMQTEVTNDQEADLYAMASMYALQQDGVPWMRISANPEDGPAAVMVRFDGPDQAATLERFYQHLQKYLPGGEFTEMGGAAVLANFTDLSDAQFNEAVTKAVEEFDTPVADFATGLHSRGNYHAIEEYNQGRKWEDPQAAKQGLEAAFNNAGRSDLPQRLQLLSEAVGKINAAYEKELNTTPASPPQQVEAERADYRKEHKAERKELANAPNKPVTVNGQRRYSVLGNAIAKDFKAEKAPTLLGKKVKTMQDLAVLAQVYRDPRYETLHYFLTDRDGNVVYQTGVSSRLPASAPAFLDNAEWVADRFMEELQDIARKTGGVNLWMQHNHPSGNPSPSHADRRITEELGLLALDYDLKLAGHVVVNHKQYGTINRFGAWDVEPLPAGTDQRYDLEQPKVPHPVLGTPLTSPQQVAAAAKGLQQKEGYVTVIGRNSPGAATLVAELPIMDERKMAASIRHLAYASGSADMFVVGAPRELLGQLDNAVASGLLLDALIDDGNGGYRSLATVAAPRTDIEKHPLGKEPKVREKVASEEAPYNAPPPSDRPPFVTASMEGVQPAELADISKRGTQTWEATENLARVLGVNAQELDKFMRREIGTAFNSEQLQQAAMNLEKQVHDAQAEFMGMVRKIDEGAMADNDWIRVEELLHELNASQAQFMGVRGEAGRALQIFRKIRETTSLSDAVGRVLEGHGGRQLLEEKLRAIASLEQDKPGATMKAVREEMAVTKFDKFMEWYINSLVSGIPTHVVNMTSNALVSGLESMTRFVASGIGAITGNRDRVTMNEAVAHAAATMPGAVAGLKAFGAAVKDENHPLQFMGKMDQVHRRAIGGKLGKVVRVPVRFLGAEDGFFKTLNMTQELYALATRESQRTGQPVQDIINNPSKELMDQAWASGLERTFTNRPGVIAQALLKMRRHHPLINLIFPFVTTPANIVNFALKYTPAGFAYRDVRKAISEGGAKRDIALARIATGSSIATGVLGLAAMGLVTGAPPEDPNERRLWYTQGNQPYSLKIGDTWYSYSRLEPMGMLFGISADMYRLASIIGTDEADKLATLIIGSVSNNLLSKTYLRGLSDAVNAMTDPERYGERWVKSLVTGIATPVFLSYTAKATDENLREAETIIEALKARVPGLSKTLEPRLDIFGRERINEGSPGYRFFSPAYVKKNVNDPVAGELLRLDVSMPQVGRKMMGVDLTTAQRNELKRLLGKSVYGAVQRVMASPKYKRLPDFAQAYVMDKVVSGVRRYGRLYWQAQHPEVMEQANQIKLDDLLSRGGASNEYAGPS